jgi:hypothetical protein
MEEPLPGVPHDIMAKDKVYPNKHQTLAMPHVFTKDRFELFQTPCGNTRGGEERGSWFHGHGLSPPHP